jgi:hypothetical protein
MSIIIMRKRAYPIILAALALALAIGAGARALPAAGSPSQSDSAAPDRSACPRIQLSDFDLPADPLFYSERDDNYMLGSYGG